MDGPGTVVPHPDAHAVGSEGSSIWWSRTVEELFGDRAVCDACGSRNVEKDGNILDVWFDSGVTHLAVLNERFGLSWPTEMYLEGKRKTSTPCCASSAKRASPS